MKKFIFALIILSIFMFLVGAICAPLLFSAPEGQTYSDILDLQANKYQEVFLKDGHKVINGSKPEGIGYYVLETGDIKEFHMYLHAWAPNATIVRWKQSLIGNNYIPTFSFLAVTPDVTWIVIFRVYNIERN